MPEIELVCVGVDGGWHPLVVKATDQHRVGDLRTALCEHLHDDVATDGPLYLGAMPLPDHLPITDSGLADGLIVGLGRPLFHHGTGLLSGELSELAVVGGLYCGPSVALNPGTELRVGRGHTADLRVGDPEVSREHAVVTTAPDGAIRLSDTGSHNGIRWQGWRLAGAARLAPGDVAAVGETVLGIRSVLLADAGVTTDSKTGRRSFNRPPRIPTSDPTSAVVVPVAPDKPASFRFPWATVLVPLLVGGLCYLLLPSAGVYLLLMVLSPVMAMANVISDRRSGRREHRVRKAEYDTAAATFVATVAAAGVDEERRARQAHPDPSWVVSAACAPSARLWERRRTDRDFLRLRVGLHDRPATLDFRFDRRYPAPAGAALPDQPMLFAVPAVVAMREVGVLGVAGDRSGLLPVVRAMLAQAAGLHAPEDLGLVVVTGRDEAADWEWLTWLPHTRPRTSTFGCARLIGTDATQVESRLVELRALIRDRLAAQRDALRQGPPSDREFLVVVDGASRVRGVPGLAELLSDGPAAGVYAICVDTDETTLPAECGATLVATNREVSRARLSCAGSAPLADVLVDGLESGYATRMAMALAPVTTLGNVTGEDALPDRVRFTELVGLTVSGEQEVDGDIVRRAWAAGEDGRSTRAILGVGPVGPLAVDLRQDGPHALVAGTTGAGKSELLQTLIASLAMANAPDAMNFVLVDYKGGSAFSACVDLPHCVGMITDLDVHLVRRVLDSLSAELRRREELLAEAGAKDIVDYWARTGARLPRLVIVIDEFASLVNDVPEFVPGVVGIGMLGRSFGVHVVLATQRPAGVVNADLRANLNLRISLRVTAETDSADVIDVVDAARIGAGRPGRAYLRTGHEALTAFQAARVAWPRAHTEDTTLRVRCRTVGALGGSDTTAEPIADADADGRTDLSALVAAARFAAAVSGYPNPMRPWLPPLAEVVTLADLPLRAGASPLSVRVGLADRPAAQAQDAFEIDLERTGPVAVAGTARTGRSTVLRTLAAGLAEAARPDLVHLYALDCGNHALAPLAELPHTGAVVHSDDPVRVTRLLEWLTGEVTRRQRLSAHDRTTPRPPHVVLLVDRLEGFTATFADRDAGRLVELFDGLLRRGPSVGVVTVFSTDRTAFGSRVAAAVEHRLVLRQADRDDVAAFGLSPRAVPTTMPAGRAVWAATGTELQTAVLDQDPSGAAQARAFGRLAALARVAAGAVAPALLPHRIDPLPDCVTATEAEALRTRTRFAGPAVCTPVVAGDHVAPVDVDLAEHGSVFVVAGPRRSGRSTALAAIVRSLAGRESGALPVVLVTPRPSPLRALTDLPGVLGVVSGDDHAELEDLLATEGPVALVVDDGELVEEYPLGETLVRFVRDARDTGSVLVVGATTEDLLLNRFRGWLAQARRARTGLLLNPESHVAGEVFDVSLSRSVAGGWPPGRGVVVLDGQAMLAQVPCSAEPMPGRIVGERG